MKYASNRNFLHPVLGQQEFLWPAKSFAPTVKVYLKQSFGKNGGPILRIETRFRLDVAAIDRLIADERAVCGVWIYCAATSYRQFFKAENNGNRRQVIADIPIGDIRGKVEAHPQVVTTTEVMLGTEEAHRVFDQEPLVLPPGTPLAVQPPTSIPLLDGDRTIKDIFSWMEDPDSGTAWDVRPDPDKATIELAADRPTMEFLKEQRETDSKWAMQTLYLAALTEALNVYLQQVGDDEQTEEDTSSSGGWVGTIKGRLAELGIRVSSDDQDPMFMAGPYGRSSTWVAQRLLGDPLQAPPPDDGEEENQ